MYNHIKIENKWQTYWESNKTFKTEVTDFTKPKFYALDMFPYPSGVGLHAGHPEGYTATDIVSRMKRMQGFNVLHPMGFDSFGLPAEQYAINTGHHPARFTNDNIIHFTKQLKALGFSYDWDRVVSTSDPSFYKWTQWIFIRLYNDHLAKQIDVNVNWCPELGTVLANDEVIDGKSERGGYPVVQKKMKQWVIDMPKYAEKLLTGLDTIDWPESTKEMQRNRIGKSMGAEVKFKVANSDDTFTVFTTRCDTLFGATYCVLSPEHPLVNKITTPEYQAEVAQYQAACLLKSDLERTDLNKEKTGVFTGAYAINPVNQKAIPIWISDYVLVSYGTGAIMAVPAHDERDYAFALKFHLDIIPVIAGGDVTKEAYTLDGKHFNSGFLDGLDKEAAINKMLEWLVKTNQGNLKINYKIHEWTFARQRYWGEPIPIVHLDNGKDVALKDSELPLILPILDDYRPAQDGSSPLARDQTWVDTSVDGVKGKRETSTMPGSAGSSWYFLRYIDPHNDTCLADYQLMKYWLPVDLYVGGPEHAVGHLLYARMWNNYLYDKGIVPVAEPFKKLVHQGMILGANGIKMGKRYPEYSVNPEDIIKEYGADTLRLYEMFMGPLEADKAWSQDGLKASAKFLDRVYRLYNDKTKKPTDELDKIYHQTIKKVTVDYENLSFNTAISQMMIFVNAAYSDQGFSMEHKEGLLKLLNPIAPHLTEELWSQLGHTATIAYEPWPVLDDSKLTESSYELVVQVNGKVRGRLTLTNDLDESTIKKRAKELDNVKKFIVDKTIVKEILVPKKILNIVIK